MPEPAPAVSSRLFNQAKNLPHGGTDAGAAQQRVRRIAFGRLRRAPACVPPVPGREAPNGQITGSYALGGLTLGSNGKVSGSLGGETPFGSLGLNIQDGKIGSALSTDYGNLGLDYANGQLGGSFNNGALGLGMHDGNWTGETNIGPINLDYGNGQWGGGMALGGSNVSYGNGSWSGTVEGNFLEQGLGETGLDTSGFEITDVSYNANEGWTGAFSNEFGTVNQDGKYSASVIPDDGDQSTTWPAVQEAATGVKTTISDLWTSIFGGEKPPEQPGQQEPQIVMEQPGQPGGDELNGTTVTERGPPPQTKQGPGKTPTLTEIYAAGRKPGPGEPQKWEDEDLYFGQAKLKDWGGYKEYSAEAYKMALHFFRVHGYPNPPPCDKQGRCPSSDETNYVPNAQEARYRYLLKQDPTKPMSSVCVFAQTGAEIPVREPVEKAPQVTRAGCTAAGGVLKSEVTWQFALRADKDSPWKYASPSALVNYFFNQTQAGKIAHNELVALQKAKEANRFAQVKAEMDKLARSHASVGRLKAGLEARDPVAQEAIRSMIAERTRRLLPPPDPRQDPANLEELPEGTRPAQNGEPAQPGAKPTECSSVFECISNRFLDYKQRVGTDLDPVQNAISSLLSDPTNPQKFSQVAIELSVFLEKYPEISMVVESVPYAGDLKPLLDAERARAKGDYWGALGHVAESGIGLAAGPILDTVGPIVKAAAKRSDIAKGVIRQIGNIPLPKALRRGAVHGTGTTVHVTDEAFRKRLRESVRINDGAARNGEKGEQFVTELFRRDGFDIEKGMDVPIPGKDKIQFPARRADLIMPDGRRLEVKNFTTAPPHVNSPRIKGEIDRDIILRDHGEATGVPYHPEWHFVGMPPTKELQDLLTLKGIPFFVYE